MRWCTEHDACVECGSAERPHFGGGRCRRCYMRRYRDENRERIRAHGRRWSREHGAEVRDTQHFGGNRAAVLERDGHRCVRCGSADGVTVHHKDRSGRGAVEHNNAMENLETLCRKCHAEEHRDELLQSRIQKKTHCKRGHVYGPPNLKWNGRQWVCIPCRNIRAAERRAKLKTRKLSLQE